MRDDHKTMSFEEALGVLHGLRTRGTENVVPEGKQPGSESFEQKRAVSEGVLSGFSCRREMGWYTRYR